MTAHRTPRTTAAATAMLERYAQLGAQISMIEGDRASALAATNAVADSLAAPVLDEIAAIEAKLAPWWTGAAPVMLTGKRKSIELGGCTIGTKAARTALSLAGDATFDTGDEAVLGALSDTRWGKELIRVKRSVDKTATRKALDGKHGDALREMGFGVAGGEDVFFVERLSNGLVATSS